MKTKTSCTNWIACIAVVMLTLLSSVAGAWPAADVESRSNWDNENGMSGNRGAERSALDMMKKMEFLQQEVQELRGKVEEQSYQLQQLQEHQKKLYMDLDRRISAGGPAKSGGVSSAPLSLDDDKSPTANQSFTQEAASLNVSQDIQAEENAYQSAYRLVQSKDYEGALGGFSSLIRSFPTGKYVPNAHYWMGEIYLTKGELDSAFASFDHVYRDYPQHPKAADSLLKLGYVAYAKGQWQRSNELLKQVKSQYPGSTSAQLADLRLDKMRQEGHL